MLPLPNKGAEVSVGSLEQKKKSSGVTQRRAGSSVNISHHSFDEVHSYVSPCANWWPNTVQPHKFRQMTAFKEILSESSFWTLAKGFLFNLNLKSWNIKEQYAST